MNPKLRSLLWKSVLIVFVPIILYFVASYRNSRRQIKDVQISFSTPYQFISKESIKKIMFKDINPNIRVNKQDIDLNRIENDLNSNSMIESSQVYITVDGVLKADINQRTPIARVISPQKIYYIDANGNDMPLSNIHTARVPIVTGTITPQNRDNLVSFLKKIYSDPYLSSNIIGVKVSSNVFSFFVRVGDFEVVLGNLENLDNKINNFKALYKKIDKDQILNKYRKVNLEFDNQVVCIEK